MVLDRSTFRSPRRDDLKWVSGSVTLALRRTINVAISSGISP